MYTSKGVIILIFVTLLMDLIAFTMILPLLPSLLDYYGNQDDKLYTIIHDSVVAFRRLLNIPDTQRWNSVLLGGMIGSLFSFLQFLSSPVTGALSDVYGRKSVLLATLFGSLLSYLVFAASSTFAIFVLARIVGGLSKGNTSLCIAILTDVTDTKDRGKAMALVGIAYSLGFLIGPIVGAGFAKLIRLHPEMFFQTPALVGVMITALQILLLMGLLHETLPPHKRTVFCELAYYISYPPYCQTSSIGGSVKGILSYTSPVSLFSFSNLDLPLQGASLLRGVGLVYFIFLFLFSGVEFTITFLVHERFNYDSMQQGKMFFFMGTVMGLIQGCFVRRLQAGTERKVAQMGVVALMVSFLVTALTTNTCVFYAGLVLFSFGSATVVPCLTTMASYQGDETQKGAVLGIFRSIGALARALGPIAACSLYWYYGPARCYLMAMVALLVPLCLLRRTESARKAH